MAEGGSHDRYPVKSALLRQCCLTHFVRVEANMIASPAWTLEGRAVIQHTFIAEFVGHIRQHPP
jgi:hypothetical protein